MNIGDKIKKIRNSKKLTQEQLANRCGLSKNGLWNYENGKRTPNIDTLESISKALEVDISLLMGDDIEEVKRNFEEVATNTIAEREIATIQYIKAIVEISDKIGYDSCSDFYNLLSVKEKLSLSNDIRKFIAQQIKAYLYVNGKYKKLSNHKQSFVDFLDAETIYSIENELRIIDAGENTSNNK